MAKITFPAGTTADYLSTFNQNFVDLAEELQDKVAYRDNPVGEPNTIKNDWDMDGNHIFNLAEPVDQNEAARLKDVINAVQGATAANLITFTPAGTISANTVQGAIEELDGDFQAFQGSIDAVVDGLADIQNNTNANLGSNLVGWKPNAAGSVGRTVAVKLLERVSVKDFGAIGNGVADDTAAIQAGIDYCGPTGRELFFPAGTYKYSGVTVGTGKSVVFMGENTGRVFLLLSSATAVGFNLTTDHPCAFENLTFGYLPPLIGTNGAFINIPADASTNYNSYFRNLQMNAPWIGINTTKAASWTMDRVSIGEYRLYGVHVQNIPTPDNGDSTIINCVMTTSITSAIAIVQRSSGGLRIINNKIIGGATYYFLQLDAGVDTSDLLIVGNSMEGSVTNGIVLRRAVASGTFANVTITGNQFAGGPNVVHMDDVIPGWLKCICVANNAMTIQGGAGVTINSASDFSVTGNAFRGALSTEIGVQVGANASNGMIGTNVFESVSVNAINNLSTTTSVVKRILTGTTGAITCSTAVGSVFTGLLPVVFPAGFFGSSPLVTATVNGGANGIGVNALSVNTAGMTLQGVAATVAANITVAWKAEADF